MHDKTNLVSKFSLIHEHWKPHVAGELNGQLVKLVKFQGANLPRPVFDLEPLHPAKHMVATD